MIHVLINPFLNLDCSLYDSARGKKLHSCFDQPKRDFELKKLMEFQSWACDIANNIYIFSPFIPFMALPLTHSFSATTKSYIMEIYLKMPIFLKFF